MKNKKLLKMGATLALVGAIGVGGTLAYLSSSTNNLVNKFTFTDQGINMDIHEQLVSKLSDGSEVDNNRFFASTDTTGLGQDYGKVLPNQTIKKDPTVRIEAGSINCYVIVAVTNANGDNLTYDYNSDNWELLNLDDYTGMAANTLYYLYQYEENGEIENVVKTSPNNQDLEEVFSVVHVGNINESVDFENIVIKAAASQSDNFSHQEIIDNTLSLLGVTKN